MNYKRQNEEVPEKTAELAKKVFKKGNRYVALRDALGIIFKNELFEELFSYQGRPAEAPGNLALIVVMQYLEKLSDRNAAEQVGSRLDWKYALGLELEAEEIRSQALSDFRNRVLEGSVEEELLNEILRIAAEIGCLKEKKKQRTDASFILSAARRVNRLELVWDALSTVIEEIAWREPKWLEKRIDARWVELYARPYGWRELGKKKEDVVSRAEEIGRDGAYLWQEIEASSYHEEWQELREIKVWRQIWEQQYKQEGEEMKWRTPEELPATSDAIESIQDVDARYSRQDGGEGWVGYQVHYTETVTSRKQPQLITEVTTTPACQPDGKTTLDIQQKLIAKDLAPEQHQADAGYINSHNLAVSKKNGVDLFGPTLADNSWQKRADTGYDLSQFQIDWEKKQVTCPQNQTTSSWRESRTRYDAPCVRVQFSTPSCRSCPAKELCTKGRHRTLTFLPQHEYHALIEARQRQDTSDFKEVYCARAGVEGTISQAVNGLNSRRSRYMGMPKTHLHNILTAAAINLNRMARWLLRHPRARTRHSPLMAMNFS